MSNAKELIEAVVYRMTHLGGVEAEVINFEGQPLVRNLHWKGEQPSPPPGRNLKVSLGCLMGLALMFGIISAYWGLQEQDRHVVASVPPQEIAVRTLIQNGLGTNRHVLLTDFRPGGYTVEAKSGSWTGIWIALFPAESQPEEATEIRVVLSAKGVRDEAALRRLLQHGRVTGICSKAPSSSWGTTLGPQLVQANQGCQLSSGWLVEELREPPSAAFVSSLFTLSVSCLMAVLVLVFVILRKAG